MIAAVIFDLFGTLLDVRNRQNPYRQLLRIGAQQGRAASPNDLRIVMALNGGIREAAEAFGIHLSPAQMADLGSMLARELESICLIDDAMPAIGLLQEHGVKVAVCSNLAGPYCSKARSLLPGLDAYALSAELGLLKPDPGIYRSTCTMLGVLPGQVVGSNSSQVLMIGDSRRCDEQGPRCFGILGHHLDRTGGGGIRDLISFAEAIIENASDS
ncbi:MULTISPECIES: HAD family hydrolase [Pseudomonas]|uniref:HAD family hydrolase n=1 Tax=unclassified Pseudomonas TaxID=196821 RepID=UPI0028A7A56D|nr:HAD family hydrolase [Pseudomonas sp.]